MTAAPTHILVQGAIENRSVPGEIRAFSACRNERLRLPAFLDHYRRLGIDRFFIVDDGSSDGSGDYLREQPDVHLFRATNLFREARGGIDWMNALLAQFANGSWCVTADIDELFVYPGCEQMPLRMLTDHLDRHGYEAVSCLLLDLYPSGRLKDCAYQAGDDLLQAAPYFDPAPYERVPVDLCPGILIRGGMRERVFYPDFRTRTLAVRTWEGIRGRAARRLPLLHDVQWLRSQDKPPVLTKVPLVRWDGRSRYLSPHWISPKVVAPLTGVLLHFKFLADFHTRAIEDAARGEHYAPISEYRRYARMLAENPDLRLAHDESARFEGTPQLVRCGLMNDTAAWQQDRERGHE